MKTKILSFIGVIFLLISCQGQTSKSVKTIDSKAFAEKIKTTPNPQLIDVRTPEEYNGGYIDNAKNINWNSDDFVTNVGKLDKSKPVFVYCKSGRRSLEAANKLSELGFEKIYNLEGGILEWIASGNSTK